MLLAKKVRALFLLSFPHALTCSLSARTSHGSEFYHVFCSTASSYTALVQEPRLGASALFRKF